MKKRFLILFMMLTLPRICWSQTPWDIAYHAIPSSAAFEFLSEAVTIGKMGVQQANNVQAVVTQAKAEATNIQSAVMTTFNSIVNGSILSELNGNAGDVQGQFFGKKLSKVKTKKIAEKFKKLFMTYDSDKGEEVQFVEENREKFYIQNMLAIAAAAEVLQAKNISEIKPKIEQTKECAEGNGSKCGIPSTNDGGKNEVWYSYASVLEQYDRLVKTMESVAALRARATAIEAMKILKPAIASEAEKKADELNTGADIKEDNGKDDKTAFNKPLKATGFSRTEIKTAFAQVMYKSPKLSLSKVETQIKTTEAPAEKLISSSIEFVAPEEPQEEHPLIANEAKLEALNEINDIKETVDSAIEAHNYLNQLKGYRETAQQIRKMQEEYNKVLAKLRESEQCSLNYFKKYFSNPVQAWSGINLINNVGRHDLRKGISGWAVEAFETAKAAETSNVTTSDIEQYSISDDETLESADDPDFSKAAQKTSGISISLSPGKLEASQEEMRRSEMVSWQIGAEASKILGEDASKWGNPTGRSMVWTDTKRFYRQYLERKYDNIRAYLQRYTKEDILALAISKLENKIEGIEDTNYQKKRRDIAVATGNEQQDEIRKMKISMQEYDKQVSAELEALMKKKNALVAKMDEISNEIKKASDDLADMRKVAEDKAAEEAESQLIPEITFPNDENNNRKASDKVPQMTSLGETQNLTISNNEVTLDEKKKEALEKKIEEGKAKRDKYNQQLEALKIQIDTTKLKAQERRIELNRSASIVARLKEKMQQRNKENVESYLGDIEKNMDAVLGKVLIGPVIDLGLAKRVMIDAAEDSLSNINKQMSAVVDASYKQMLDLGDELYKPSAHGRIVEIHQQMIDQLKAINLVYTAAGLYTTAGIINFTEAAIYAKLLSADTSAETEGFFVGSEPKERDLRAPYKILNFDLPPVREVFHFDATDFKAVKPQNNNFNGRNLTASEFLNSGEDIPKIWQYMLRSDSFIESQYNLKDALNGGCEDVAFARGGIMPCVVEGTKIVIDAHKNGEYITRADLKAADLPKCLLIDMKKGRPHHMLLDAPVIFYILQPIAPDGPLEKMAKRNCEYSELGMLLDSDDNNNLSFKPLAYNSFIKLVRNSTNTGEMSDIEKNEIAAANHAMLSRNQIGDFLRHVEEESNARKNLEEIKQQHEEQKEEMKQSLQKFGFSPTENFDLADDKDYANAFSQIKSIKDQLISKAVKEIKAVDVSENKPATQQREILKKLIYLMQKDPEAHLNIADDSADLSNPDEELKKAKADNSVVDKLKNSLKEREKEYTDISQAYCANYGE